MVRALAVPRIMHKYDLVLAPGAGRLLRHFYLYALALSNRDASSGPLRSWRPRSAACFVVYNTRYRRQRYESLSFNAGSDPRVCPRATRVTRHMGFSRHRAARKPRRAARGKGVRYLLTYLVLPGVSCINRASSASTRLVASLTPSPRVRAASRTARSSRNVAADVLNSDDRSAIR